jgi:hypothetical protein
MAARELSCLAGPGDTQAAHNGKNNSMKGDTWEFSSLAR